MISTTSMWLVAVAAVDVVMVMTRGGDADVSSSSWWRRGYAA